MNAASERNSSATSDREITATRVFEAPRELVFDAWTDPKHIAQWWGPKGFTNTIHTMDVRPGGVWDFIMHGPDGVDYKNKVIYREVVRPERLTYDHVSGPLFHVTVTFEAQGEKTQVTMTMLFDSAKLRNQAAEKYGAVEGLNQNLGRLADHLPKLAAERSAEEFAISRDNITMTTIDRFREQAPRILGVFRILAGVMFSCYGAQKLFGAFGGIPAGAPKALIWSAGSIEFLGGILIAIGLFTRSTAFLASGLMACAYFIGHAGNGFWPKTNGGEPAIMYCWLFLYIAAQGPGAWALDNLRTRINLP